MPYRAKMTEVSKLLLTKEQLQGPLNDLATVIATALSVPHAAINLLDDESCWTVAGYGMNITRLDRVDSFCHFSLETPKILEVPDSLTDDRFKDSKFVLQSPFIRFYAGQPLVGSTGSRLGTLAVFGPDVRALDAGEAALLEQFSRIAVGLLEASGAVSSVRVTEENLQAQREFSNAVLENLADGVIACDGDGRLTLFNRAAREFHGLDANYDLATENWSTHYGLFRSDSITPLTLDEIPLLKALSGDKLHQLELVVRPTNGVSKRILCNGQPIFNSSGKRVGAVATLHDVTELKAKQLELLETNQALRSATQAKSEFLANMSHEIRTPLNGITGMAELLLDTSLGGEHREYVELIQSSAKHLLTVVSDILDFSKIEAGKIDLEKIDFKISDVIDDVYKTLLPLATAKKIEFVWPLGLNRELTFHGDPGRIKQVMFNLASNAIKFTEQGSVKCAVVMDCLAGEKTKVTVSISDSGIGISAEAQRRLFKAFSQADSSTSRKFGGTGLGLSISKRLLELMGGEIGVTSIENKGSTFWFALTLDNVCELDNGVKDGDQTVRLQSPISHLKVLLAEDNMVNQRLAMAVLKKLGVNAELAKDGQEAVELASQNNYNLILMDCQMPVVDGFEATRRIRSMKCGPFLPVRIVALTANAMSGDRERCLAAGMDDYISKPFKADDIRRILNDISKID